MRDPRSCNWQDRENPQAGGAEIHLHEIFGRLAARGHEVTLLCGGWPGCAAARDARRHRRASRGDAAHVPVPRASLLQARPRATGADVLVEDINKVPLYTPRWGAKRDRRARAASVRRRRRSRSSRRRSPPRCGLPSGRSAASYRDVPFEAISESTADDLAARGIPRASHRGDLSGHRHRRLHAGRRGALADAGRSSYLGRLKKYKGVHLVIRAFAAMQHPDGRSSRSRARATIGRRSRRSRTRLTSATACEFLGRISEAEKLALLRRSWALVFASPKEGWGITNLEAAACATPVVASNSPGIRESVRDGETGFLVPHGDVAAHGRGDAPRRERSRARRTLGARRARSPRRSRGSAAAEQTERHLAARHRRSRVMSAPHDDRSSPSGGCSSACARRCSSSC